MILCIETATDLCSVALCDTGGPVILKENDEGRSHASVLTVYIEEILKDSGIRAGYLEAVAVSKGPGSYTGLRIGVSVAKGMAYAASIPLIGIETTLSMFHGFSDYAKKKFDISSADLFCPALDARRMEVYYSVLDARGNAVSNIKAEIMDKNSFSEFPESVRIFLFGDGAEKCRGVLVRKNLIIDTDFRISASFMYKPAYEALNNKRFEDVAYFEPFYLKDFLTSKPVKNVLGK
jgi:tRNA threonylcarbamoyladenosine biosynthesis protein TsaB